MQATQTGTIRTIQALRAIGERSIYKTGTTTPVDRHTTGKTEMTKTGTKTDAEAWARRAVHANGFGDAGI